MGNRQYLIIFKSPAMQLYHLEIHGKNTCIIAENSLCLGRGMKYIPRQFNQLPKHFYFSWRRK